MNETTRTYYVANTPILRDYILSFKGVMQPKHNEFSIDGTERLIIMTRDKITLFDVLDDKVIIDTLPIDMQQTRRRIYSGRSIDKDKLASFIQSGVYDILLSYIAHK